MDQQLIWLLFLSIPLLLFLFKQKTQKEQLRLPPGPWKLPIIGNLHQLSTMPHDSLHKLAKKYGPLMFLKLGSVPTVVISSGDLAEEIFKTHDIAFSNRPRLYVTHKLLYDLDLAGAPYGEYWRQLRKVSMIEVLSTMRVETFRAVREEEVGKLVDFIRNHSATSPTATVDLDKMVITLLNNVACQIVFGEIYKGRLSKYNEGGSRFYEVLQESVKALGGFILVDYFPSLEWVHTLTGLKQRIEKSFNELDRFYDQMIQEHIDNKASPGHEDLTHVLLRLHNDPAHSATFGTMNNVKGLITDVFIAGSDTSSTSVIWTMTHLMRNPRLMKKVKDELQKVVGSKSRVDESDVQKLEYLKLVVKETLRLHPPSPLLLPRETTEACTIKGCDIPAKTRVFVNATAISRDPNFWTNPEEFWPERFLEKSRGYKPGPHYDYVPFGIGRRICPGMTMALAIVELTLANLLHSFRLGAT